MRTLDVKGLNKGEPGGSWVGNQGKSGLIAVVFILVVATAIAVWMRRRDFVPSLASSKSLPEGVVAKPMASPTGEGDIAPVPEESKAANAPAAPEAPVDLEFQKWVSAEAKELDQINVDASEKRRQIRSKVSQMTIQQSRQLLQTVKSSRAPAGEKILSTFLLVEGGARTQKELADLIASPLTEDPNYAPHSEEEMKGIREKSLRIMAIDGLYSRARSEPSARETLTRAARETSDPAVRAYAEDKLRQLQ